MSTLLVSIPTASKIPYSPTNLDQRSLLDIEILLPQDTTNPSQISVLEQIIKTGENNPCDIKYNIVSDKQYKADITIVFIVRIEAKNGIYNEYQLCLQGKICSDFKGEESLMKTWTFLKTYSNATEQQQTELHTFLDYNKNKDYPIKFIQLI